MNARSWTAQWIWGGHEESPRNEWRCFRKVFELPAEGLEEAWLHLAADSRYILYVNGERIGRGPVRSWREEQFYDSYEVGHLLRAGQRNVIAVHVLHFGLTNFYYIRGRGGLLAELECTFTPDSNAVRNNILRICSDDTWSTSKLLAQNPRSPRMCCQQGFADVYDARAWDEKWILTCYREDGPDSTWEKAKCIGPAGVDPWKRLKPRDIPFLTEEKMYPSRLVSLRRVQAPSWTAAIDLRAAMVPDSILHANPVSYVGYLAGELLLKESGTITLGFPGGWRTDRVWVDGKLCTEWFGDTPERYCTLDLDAGEHFVLIDVTSWDHGGSFHLAANSEAALEWRTPGGTGTNMEETPFVLIGPFDTMVHIDHQEPQQMRVDHPEYVKAAGAASVKELADLSGRIRPLPGALYCEDDVLGAGIWTVEAESLSIPSQLEHAILPTPEPAVIPRFENAESDYEIVIDVGRETTGFIGFEVEAKAGTIIDVYGIEYIRDEFRQHTYGLDNTIRYICREGRQRYLSPVRRGFRYMVLTIRGAEAPVRLYEVYVHQSTYPVTNAGAFQCSDMMLNEIWNISRHTTRLCMEDTFVDCPSYEQVFWVGDSRNEALVNYYVFGALDIVKRCLNLVPGSKDMSPLYIDQVPSGWSSVIPNWTFFWSIACLEYVEHANDRDFAMEIWPAVRFTLEHYLKNLNADGLLDMRGWNLLDWAPIDQPNDGIVTHQNLVLVLALKKAAELARIAGEDAEATKPWIQAAKTLSSAINAHLWEEGQQAYLDCIHSDGRRSDIFSMQTQVLAYLSGVASGKRKEIVGSYLLDPPSSFVQIGSPFMSFFYYEALAEAGRYEHMLNDIRFNYGQMLRYDATTCWEMYPNFTENRANKDQLTRSHCHAWSAAPGYFLGRNILGVKRADPGWTRILVEPQPCDLVWARGSVPLPQGGRMDVSWSVDGDMMDIDVFVPGGVEVEVRVPDGMQKRVKIVESK
ncbi:family 78 glycoside hydrolase catalytic domain [Paenibacillus sp. HJL G12]|uniref:Family 78 glycoside hydrolase catalytic domain n=1 Tax=Paenibacillus dendrobii TaxID=2691084 RepID=A0A7X3IME1_9BACL|nr:family 78 glycoside hydrolase catalytic domain [Paenibacillus dendrobii]MWV46106.1 family 78 glycoside hydrolase catalytic domain [Paenibacillus dendrobii]